MIARLARRCGLGALAATLLLAAPASAHPFFEPAEVPVESLATVTLDLAHGCAAEEHGEDGTDGETQGHGEDEQAPTREVAIEVPRAVSFVDPGQTDGWDLEVEESDGIEVLVYTAQEGTDEPAPRFDLDVVHEGEVGDEVHWRVLQACDDATHRWVATPDEPAEEPAVTVVLAAADPDAPPPEESEDTASATSGEDVPDEEAPVAPEADGPQDADEDGLAVGGADEGGMPGWILIVVLIVTLLIAGVVLSLKGRDGETGGDEVDGA